MSHTRFGFGLLSGGPQEELGHLPHGQTLGQVIKGAVFLAPMMAAAVFLAADREALDKRGTEQVRVDFELGEQPVLTLAQGEGGLAAESIYPSHI